MIRRYQNNIFTIVLLLCGLMVLTFACEREDIPESGGENPDPSTVEPVSVNFKVSEMGFGENEITVRNAASPVETVVIPVSDNRFCKSACYDV